MQCRIDRPLYSLFKVHSITYSFEVNGELLGGCYVNLKHYMVSHNEN